MTLTIESPAIPLRVDEDGVIRVTDSRMTLDIIVESFLDGASAEEIAARYRTLQLADVYTIIGYYLQHREEVDAYLKERREFADAVRKENLRRFPPDGLREQLLARGTEKEFRS